MRRARAIASIPSSNARRGSRLMWVPAMLRRARATIELRPWASARARPASIDPNPSYGRPLTPMRAPFVTRMSATLARSSSRSARPRARSASGTARTRSSSNQYARANWCSIWTRPGSSPRSSNAASAGSSRTIASGARHPLTTARPRRPTARASRSSLAQVVPDGRSLRETRLCDLRVTGGVGRQPGTLEQVGPIGWVARDLERLEEEHAGLVVAAEGRGTLCGAAQGQPCLCRDAPGPRGHRSRRDTPRGSARRAHRPARLRPDPRRSAPPRGAGSADRAWPASRTPPRGRVTGRTRTGRARAIADRRRGRAARAGRAHGDWCRGSRCRSR